MATYAQFRSALVTTLTALVTDNTIERLYEYPPLKLEDEPAIVMLGSSGKGGVSVGEGAIIDITLTEQLRIYVFDNDPQVACGQVEAIRTAIHLAIQANNGMDGTGTIYELEWETIVGIELAGQSFYGQTIRLNFVLN